MKREFNSNPRPELRKAWETWRPPGGVPDRVTDGTPAPSPRRGWGTRPAHLVLTNDAGWREDSLLGVAGRLAERAGASIHVAHLYTSPPSGGLELAGHLTPVGSAGAVGDILERLFLAARTLADRTGLPVSPELLVGAVEPTLTAYVRANEFDLVTVDLPHEKWTRS
jgi:hypothetical protein